MNQKERLAGIAPIFSALRLIIGAALSIGGIQAVHSGVIYSGAKNITINWPYVYSFDINSDGGPEFTIKTDRGGNGSPPPGGNPAGEWLVSGFNPAVSFDRRVLREPGSSWGFSAALPYGFSIGQTAPAPLYWGFSDAPLWNTWGTFSSPAFETANGLWWGASHKYLGVEFQSGVGTYYGWAQLSVDASNGKLILHDYAYENTGAPILAGVVPEPGILALMGLGATFRLLGRKQTL